MNQLGPLFREARIQSGKTLDDAVRETKIAKKYLIAIENEDFDIFPGETYLVGFLRNYAQFLGLDSDEMVIKYRDYKIQEQPAPIEQLVARPKNARRNILLAFVVLIVIGAALYVILGGKDSKGEEKQKKAQKTEQVEKAVSEDEARAIVFEEEELTRDFSRGDKISISHKGKEHIISIDGIEEDLLFSISSIPFSLAADERVEIDFDRDGRKDLLIRTNMLGVDTVNLTIKRLYKTAVTDSDITLSGEEESAGTITGPPEVVIIKESDLVSTGPIAPETGFQIVSGYERTDISTLIRARATVYVGYYVDEEGKEEALLKAGDELEINAEEMLRLTATNANAAEMEINRVPVDLGKSGETVLKLVRWYRDASDSDLFHLVIDDWNR
ncbi:MAG: helix-turn-helix domain-containing protein [Spirochaetes bacterium]|nr:helix-turn-helix domain-containing protein [Spirochaetota bacterium]